MERCSKLYQNKIHFIHNYSSTFKNAVFFYANQRNNKNRVCALDRVQTHAGHWIAQNIFALCDPVTLTVDLSPLILNE